MTKLIKRDMIMDRDGLPENMRDLIAFLQKQLESIPEKYRAYAVLELDAYIDLDGDEANYEMYYFSPEVPIPTGSII